MKTEFMNSYEELDALNEVFNYNENEILSDEELKKITDQLDEIMPLYKKADEEARAKYKELKASVGSDIRAISNDPEWCELNEKSRELWRQMSPLRRKLDRHNEILRYKFAADSQLATEEDWDRIIGYEWNVTIEDLEVKVYTEEEEYPSGWNYSMESPYWTTVPAQSGIIDRWSITVEVTKEHVADFLDKEVEEVTTKDIMDIDEKEFINYLSMLDEFVDQAYAEATKAAEDGDYDYDSVKWKD